MATNAEIRREVIQSVRATQGAERRARIQEWSQMIGVSEATIYRWSQNGKRKQRADAGARRIDIDDDVWMMMVALYVQFQFNAEEVVRHAEANKWIGLGLVKPKTFSSWLRKAGIGRSKMQDTGKQGL